MMNRMPVPDHFRLIGRMICTMADSIEDLKTEKRLETSTAERRSAGFTFNHGFNAKRGYQHRDRGNLQRAGAVLFALTQYRHFGTIK